MILLRQKIYSKATKLATLKKAGFTDNMAKIIRKGGEEGKWMGGYGKWSKDLVAKSNEAKAVKMTHPQKMRARKNSRLMAGINGEVSLESRLNTYKYNKANGYL